jgi:hypothetical protein
MTEIAWDGITRAETLHNAQVEIRHALAGAAQNNQWPSVVKLLEGNPELINSSFLDDASYFSPLHQAAHSGASVVVIQQLIRLGAWRTLQNAWGERPVDVANRLQHTDIVAALAPEFTHDIPHGVLIKIQAHFHALISRRAKKLVKEHFLRLPELEPLLELETPGMWFPVPGMYGGFNYRFETIGVNAKLISESWCRVCGGSGQRHVITSEGCVLVNKGFV